MKTKIRIRVPFVGSYSTGHLYDGDIVDVIEFRLDGSVYVFADYYDIKRVVIVEKHQFEVLKWYQKIKKSLFG